MKFFRFLLIFLVSISFLISCEKKKDFEKSRVVRFHYGGYGDNVNGFIEGKAIKIVTLDKIIGAGKFEVEINHSKRIIVKTDLDGNYLIKIPNGNYDLKYILKGYQPIIIKNYKSFEDQFTRIDVNFEQGNETQIFNAPKWEQ
ncbi:hypothetical protein [Cloacibacterium normanense]|uniref:Putative lipoprotein n=1 Tax=Cloacibacterium normanense TaxID=237258 RepID=A0A1E5UFG8_9FLAO|nr:hypothetical protein [Cloacibacterium normanense]AZI69827.1 hypothetical protein EB819_08070 [Cloacibacterium normanense]OEL11644.1 putative lipoprotein [Cloacibacterium normanense]SDO78777.1 hypothetical protein SAMN04489756_11843 [Cloacibacterium normanense]